MLGTLFYKNRNNLTPMLGGFHMAKSFLHCIGKFIKINGLFDTFTETGSIGTNTAEEFAGITHYVRSFNGMLILLEALLKLKWNAFWEKKCKCFQELGH